MATPKSLGSGKIKYSAKDAAALMPLLVGFKPAGRNNDLGIIEPLCTYRPPKADVLRQSWKIHNTETLDAVAAAMKKCGTSCLFALNFNNPDFTKAKRDVNKNNYLAVLGRVAVIESKIKEILEDKDISKTMTENAVDLRLGTINALQAKIKFSNADDAKNIMQEFIINNSMATEANLRKILDLPNPNSRPWSGLGNFDTFWKDYILSSDNQTEYAKIAQLQEMNEINSFSKIMALQQLVYDTMYSKLNKNSQAAVQASYLSKLYDGNVPVNTKIEADKRQASNYFEKYLWNLILERFEILDSTLSTFFSLVCATRNVHVPLVNKLMQHAIFYCCYPLFSCVTKPVLQVDSSTNNKAIKDILGVLSEHSDTFKLFLGSIFEGMKTLIIRLSDPEKNLLQTHIFERLLHRSGDRIVMLGPRVDSKERTPVYTAIETLINKKLETVPSVNMKTYIQEIKKSTAGTLNVFRTSGGKANPVAAILEHLSSDDIIVNHVKHIVYIRLYNDSISYGMFHFTKDSDQALKKYFKAVNNPLTKSFGDAAADETKEVISGYTKLVPCLPAEVLTATPSALIMAALNLKENFTPEKSPSSNQQQQQKQRPASAASKKSTPAAKDKQKKNNNTPLNGKNTSKKGKGKNKQSKKKSN